MTLTNPRTATAHGPQVSKEGPTGSQKAREAEEHAPHTDLYSTEAGGMNKKLSETTCRQIVWVSRAQLFPTMINCSFAGMICCADGLHLFFVHLRVIFWKMVRCCVCHYAMVLLSYVPQAPVVLSLHKPLKPDARLR
jgi:hypothetical protein